MTLSHEFPWFIHSQSHTVSLCKHGYLSYGHAWRTCIESPGCAALYYRLDSDTAAVLYDWWLTVVRIAALAWRKYTAKLLRLYSMFVSQWQDTERRAVCKVTIFSKRNGTVCLVTDGGHWDRQQLNIRSFNGVKPGWWWWRSNAQLQETMKTF